MYIYTYIYILYIIYIIYIPLYIYIYTKQFLIPFIKRTPCYRL